jgi:hypothetical protein
MEGRFDPSFNEEEARSFCLLSQELLTACYQVETLLGPKTDLGQGHDLVEHAKSMVANTVRVSSFFVWFLIEGQKACARRDTGAPRSQRRALAIHFQRWRRADETDSAESAQGCEGRAAFQGQ